MQSIRRSRPVTPFKALRQSPCRYSWCTRPHSRMAMIGCSFARISTDATSRFGGIWIQSGEWSRTASRPTDADADLEQAPTGQPVRSRPALPRHESALSEFALDRAIALDQHALHDPVLADRVVEHDAMHGGAVIPHHDVADVPDMAEMVLGLTRFGAQFVEHRVALRPLEPDDAILPVGIEIERLAAGLGMGAHQRMLDVGRLGDLLRRARRRPVAGARRVVAVDGTEAVDPPAQRLG